MSDDSPVELVLDRLRAHGSQHRHSGEGWSARCPAHDDKNPSLSVGEGDDGRALVTCHAGCDTADVLAALHLTKADLFVDNGSRPDDRYERTYDYVDEDGQLLYQAVRSFPKRFKLRRPGPGADEWIWNTQGVRRGPYRLPEVIKTASVGGLIFVVEGEKDADRLHALGLVATTNAGGAGKWDSSWGPWFQRASVVVIPDNDEPGQLHARQVIVSLRDHAADVRLLELPDLPAKGDVSDWLNAHDDDVLGLLDLMEAAGASAPEAVELYPQLDWAEVFGQSTSEHSWFLEPLLPLGRTVNWYSDNRAMKSLLALYICACLATGRAVFGRPAGEPVDVLYVDQEMARDDVLDRLQDMGFGPGDDLSHLHYLLQTAIPPLDTELGGAAVHGLVAWYGAVFVVIDTMAESVAGPEDKADTYRDFTRHTGRELKDRGITVLHLDHEGVDSSKPRGSTGKKNMDLVIHVVKAKDELSVGLTSKWSRQPWVPKTVTAHLREMNGVLSFELDPVGWPAGTYEAAQDLDRLNVALGATVRSALTTLRNADVGKRREVVGAALQYRRQQARQAASTSGNTPGNTPRDDSRGTPGNTAVPDTELPGKSP